MQQPIKLCFWHWPVELRDDLADSFGSASRGGDDVLAGTTAVPPQLAGGAVHSLLSGSDGMNCALMDTERRRLNVVCRAAHPLSDRLFPGRMFSNSPSGPQWFQSCHWWPWPRGPGSWLCRKHCYGEAKLQCCLTGDFQNKLKSKAGDWLKCTRWMCQV